jgi:predicted DNA-binding transcriptional regulator AlpA
MSEPIDRRTLTVDDLVDRWAGTVSRRVIYRLNARGQGPRGFRCGRRLLFLLVEVESWERKGGSRWIRIGTSA